MCYDVVGEIDNVGCVVYSEEQEFSCIVFTIVNGVGSAESNRIIDVNALGCIGGETNWIRNGSRMYCIVFKKEKLSELLEMAGVDCIGGLNGVTIKMTMQCDSDTLFCGYTDNKFVFEFSGDC